MGYRLASLLERVTRHNSCLLMTLDHCHVARCNNTSELTTFVCESGSLAHKLLNCLCQLMWLMECTKNAKLSSCLSGRQFKEAGRLAAESKTLSAKLEEERSEVKTTSAHLDEMSGQLSEISARLEALRKETDLEEQKEGRFLLLPRSCQIVMCLEVGRG